MISRYFAHSEAGWSDALSSVLAEHGWVTERESHVGIRSRIDVLAKRKNAVRIYEVKLNLSGEKAMWSAISQVRHYGYCISPDPELWIATVLPLAPQIVEMIEDCEISYLNLMEFLNQEESMTVRRKPQPERDIESWHEYMGSHQNALHLQQEGRETPLPPKDAQTPVRSLQERFENAEMILMRDRMKWTPAQEEHFLMKWQELCDLYQEEFPGTEWPCLRYDKDGLLEVAYPLLSFWKVLS